jgi:branched-chain amino acid transport system permease protein
MTQTKIHADSATTTGSGWALPLSPEAKERITGLLAGRRRKTTITVALFVILVALLPFVLDPYWLYLASSWMAYTIAVMGARVLFGITGIFSLAQATFVGIGAYTAAVGATVLGLAGLYEIVLVIGVSVGASLLVGIPALRVSGLRLALVTLAVGELFQWWIREQRAVTGGLQGLPVASFYIPGLDMDSPYFLYGLCAVSVGLATVVLARIPHTQLGRNMAAVRESQFAARSVGISLSRTKLAAFVIAGVCAGVSGFLVAHLVGSVTPATFGLFPSVYILVGVILGGSGSTLGAWIGAAYVSLVPPLFSAVGQDRLYVLLSGALLVALIYLLPGGAVQLKNVFIRGKNTGKAAP